MQTKFVYDNTSMNVEAGREIIGHSKIYRMSRAQNFQVPATNCNDQVTQQKTFESCSIIFIKNTLND